MGSTRSTKRSRQAPLSKYFAPRVDQPNDDSKSIVVAAKDAIGSIQVPGGPILSNDRVDAGMASNPNAIQPPSRKRGRNMNDGKAVGVPARRPRRRIIEDSDDDEDEIDTLQAPEGVSAVSRDQVGAGMASDYGAPPSQTISL